MDHFLTSTTIVPLWPAEDSTYRRWACGHTLSVQSEYRVSHNGNYATHSITHIKGRKGEEGSNMLTYTAMSGKESRVYGTI